MGQLLMHHARNLLVFTYMSFSKAVTLGVAFISHVDGLIAKTSISIGACGATKPSFEFMITNPMMSYGLKSLNY